MDGSDTTLKLYDERLFLKVIIAISRMAAQWLCTKCANLEIHGRPHKLSQIFLGTEGTP